MDWEGEGKVMPDFDKLEASKRAGSQQAGDLPQWAARQQKVFTNWINNKVWSNTAVVSMYSTRPHR